MSRACPVCSAQTRGLGSDRAPHPLRACHACGHRFALATPEQLERLYGASYDGFREDPIFEASVRRLLSERVTPLLSGPVNLLDVGCGNGTVLRVARDLGWKAKGIDMSAAAVAFCKARGLDADVVDFATEAIEPASYDLVTFWDVLEHLIEPRLFIRSAARVLRSGGLLLVKVPAHRRLSVAVSAYVPRLSRAVLMTPAHLQFFSKNSLRILLGELFEDVRWVPVAGLRGSAMRGSLRRRLGRSVVHAIQRTSGDHTLLAVARRTTKPAEPSAT